MHAYTSSRWAAWIAPKRLSRQAGVEVLGFMLALIAFTATLVPDDPFLLNRPFPWLWLGPLLLALRYGTVAAFGSALLLIFFWWLLPLLGRGGGPFPGIFFLGGLILTLLAGEFADIWSTRLRRVSEVNAYLSERLDALTRRHYLLRLSHERLEQQLLAKPVTLNDALQHLRQLVVDAPPGEKMPQAQELLRLLSQACQLEVASLHALDKNRHPLPVPIASIGGGSALRVDDPLVQYALVHNTLCHVQSNAPRVESSRYLIAAPLTDSAGEAAGLLVVERLPFLSLNQETLCFLAVLGGYYSDSVRLAPAAREVLKVVPDCPLLFAGELARLHRIHQETGIASTLAALVIEPGKQQDEIIQETLRQTRQLDVVWQFSQHGRHFLFTLMPLHGDVAMTGYASRTEHWLRDAFGFKGLGEAGMALHSTGVAAATPAELLRTLLSRCRYARL